MKLQPNFSWQKYENEPENEKEQFQFQLQEQHIQVANSVNSTIDDISYFIGSNGVPKQRMTSETWIDGKAIWKVTVILPTLPNAAGSVQAAHGIDFTTVSTVVNVEGIAFDPVTPTVIPLNFPNPASLAGQVTFNLDGTYVNATVGADRSNFTKNYVTIWFTKQ